MPTAPHIRLVTWALPLAFQACAPNASFEPDSPSLRLAAVGPAGDAPSNLSAIGSRDGVVQLTWQDNSAHESGFEVHRSDTGPDGTYFVDVTTTANVVEFFDFLPRLYVEFDPCYKVRAVRVAGRRTAYSEFSSVACATLPVADVAGDAGGVEASRATPSVKPFAIARVATAASPRICA